MFYDDSIAGSWAALAVRLNARSTVCRWAANEPSLAGLRDVDQVHELLAAGSDAGRADEILGALLCLAAADGPRDDDALLVLLHCLGNTVTTVQQAMALFFQPEIRKRCVPSSGRPATDIADLIAQRGTMYLLGREDPYASAAPLMTAIAEHVLDTALWAATTATHGRMTPCFLACLDELWSTTPLPTLRVRMANERALGLSFIYAAQTWKQMVVSYGEDEARSLFGLTNTLVIFGGGKDVQFYRELSELIDDVRISRQTVSDGPGGIGTSRAGEDVRVLRPGDIRRIQEKHALVVAGNAPPIIAKLRRCFDGKEGKQLMADLEVARARVTGARVGVVDLSERTAAALVYARDNRLAPPRSDGLLDDAAGAGQAPHEKEWSW